MTKIESGLLYTILIIAIISLIFTLYTTFRPTDVQMPKTMSRMGFTAFDVQLAKEFMDEDNDGLCDSCGMRIEDCIAVGMMECSMDPNAKIGVLGSAHKHANFKIFNKGEEINFAKPEYYMKSMMLHLDEDSDQKKAGGVLHMHAEGVPLWLFFESIKMQLPNIKLYVNNILNIEGLNYVFKDKDKLLLTNAIDKQTIQKQLSLI